MTHSEKIQLTKEIKSVFEYIQDLNNEIKNQYPQPNGNIFLHGDIITLRLYNEAVRSYNISVMQRNAYTAKQTPLLPALNKIEKRKR